jgi:hypothetical protein
MLKKKVKFLKTLSLHLFSYSLHCAQKDTDLGFLTMQMTKENHTWETAFGKVDLSAAKLRAYFARGSGWGPPDVACQVTLCLLL